MQEDLDKIHSALHATKVLAAKTTSNGPTTLINNLTQDSPKEVFIQFKVDCVRPKETTIKDKEMSGFICHTIVFSDSPQPMVVILGRRAKVIRIIVLN